MATYSLVLVLLLRLHYSRYSSSEGPCASSSFKQACMSVNRLWKGSRESRRCSRDTYPETYITTYTSIKKKDGPTSDQLAGNKQSTESHISRLAVFFDTMYFLISFRKSTLPQKAVNLNFQQVMVNQSLLFCGRVDVLKLINQDIV
jgi:hypothetical protein